MNDGYTPDERTTLDLNRTSMVAVVNGMDRSPASAAEATLGIELERYVVDPTSGTVVSYMSKPGVHDLLERWQDHFNPGDELMVDGRLFGFAGSIEVPGADGPQKVGISITLEPGSQLELSVGPSTAIKPLLDAIEKFDDLFQRACEDLGVAWQLVALGVDPIADNPSDIPLIPKTRYRLMDEYLTKTGRYTRDMMRASASTQISIDIVPERPLAESYRLAVALGPLISFLCDNVSTWRGLSHRDTPRMARSRIWQRVDPARCGVVPGTFSPSFDAEVYVNWLMGIQPILFTDDTGFSFSTGSATTEDMMSLRRLSLGEIQHLLSMVFPNTRLKGFIEIRDADALPPRMAGAYAAFIKGLFYDANAFEGATELLCRDRKDADIAEAHEALRTDGWNATVYGYPVGTLVRQLVHLAENGLPDQEEREIFHALSSLWGSQLVPGNLYRANLSD